MNLGDYKYGMMFTSKRKVYFIAQHQNEVENQINRCVDISIISKKHHLITLSVYVSVINDLIFSFSKLSLTSV